MLSMSRGYIMLYSGIGILIVTFLMILAIMYIYSSKKKQVKKLYDFSRDDLLKYIDIEVDKVLDKREVNKSISSKGDIDKNTEFFNDNMTTAFKSTKTEEM